MNRTDLKEYDTTTKAVITEYDNQSYTTAEIHSTDDSYSYANFSITYEYEVNGVKYTGHGSIPYRRKVLGTKVKIRYKSTNPKESRTDYELKCHDWRHTILPVVIMRL